MILAKQEGSPNKVILATPDGSGVNQLLFASPELAGQQIQVPPEDVLSQSECCHIFVVVIPLSWLVPQFVTESSDQSILKPVVEYCVVCGDKASGRELKCASMSRYFSNK